MRVPSLCSLVLVALFSCSPSPPEGVESSSIDQELRLPPTGTGSTKTILDTLATPPGGARVDRAYQMADADASLTGWSNVRSIGGNVAFVGDLDADGHDEVVIAGTGTQPGSAAAYVVSGRCLMAPRATWGLSFSRRSSNGTTRPLVPSSFRPVT
jgi:hypothetical protein